MTLAACARPVGDFGRAEADPLHDEVMPAVGSWRAKSTHEPVSAFNLTDQEQEMRDRVWRYLVAPHAYDWFGDIVAELQRTRIVPAGGSALRTDLYYQWLHTERFVSSRVRYTRVADDVTADIGTMPSTFASICAVQNGDRQRGIAANGLPNLEDSVRADAAARQAENNMTIDWFVRAVRNRYDSFGYALDHLLVETPHEEAVGSNSALSDLEVYVEAAERGDFCNPITAVDGRHGGAPIRSRVLGSPPDGSLHAS